MPYRYHALLTSVLILFSLWLIQHQMTLEQQWQQQDTMLHRVAVQPSPTHVDPVNTADQLIQALKQQQLTPEIHYQNDHILLRFNNIKEKNWRMFWSNYQSLLTHPVPLKAHYCHLYTVKKSIHAKCRFNFH